MLDPDAQTLHIFGGDARPTERLGEDTLSDDAILPGFSCRVSESLLDRRTA